MNFYGLTKLTLLDYPGHTACTVFTHGCNLRCPFCHNACLVTRGETRSLGGDTVFDFLKRRRGLIDGVCISGGEPLMHRETANFAEEVKKLGFLVKLDTNGCFPDRLKTMVSCGLVDYIAMDIKSGESDYASAAGVQSLDLVPVKKSIRFLLSGNTEYEFRTTLVKGLHTLSSVEGAARLIEGAKRYYLQAFVDSKDLVGTGCAAFSPSETNEILNAARVYVKNARLRGI